MTDSDQDQPQTVNSLIASLLTNDNYAKPDTETDAGAEPTEPSPKTLEDAVYTMFLENRRHSSYAILTESLPLLFPSLNSTERCYLTTAIALLAHTHCGERVEEEGLLEIRRIVGSNYRIYAQAVANAKTRILNAGSEDKPEQPKQTGASAQTMEVYNAARAM